MLRRRRHKAAVEREVSLVFARLLADQVGAGLQVNPEPRNEAELRGWQAELEDSVVRARRSLMAIGIMLERATGDDPVVVRRCSLSARSRQTAVLREVASASDGGDAA